MPIAVLIPRAGVASGDVNASDSGAGADVVTQLGHAAQDTGAAADVALAQEASAWSGVVTESTLAGGGSPTASDAAAGTDSASITAALTASDSGAGADFGVASTGVAASDAATGADSALLSITRAASDSASSLETASVDTPRVGVDSGVGTDQASVSIPPPPPPVTPSLRIGEFAFAAQSAKGSPAAQPKWALPLGMPNGHGLPGPTVEFEEMYPANPKMGLQDVRRVAVPWGREVGVPAFPGSIAALLKALLPAETVNGTSHELRPGMTDIWHTFWTRRPGGLYERYIDGLVDAIRLDFVSGEPVDVTVQAQGLRPEVLAAEYTPLNRENVRAGFLTYVGANVLLEWTTGSPATFRWEVEGGSISIFRPGRIHGSYKDVAPLTAHRGQLAIEIPLTLVFRDYDHYRSSVYGDGVAVPVRATVYGSASITFMENTVGGTRTLELEFPAVAWEVPAYDPLSRPEQGAVILEMVGRPVVPAAVGRTGALVVATVQNGLSGSS
jgi:hypothetical protein